VLPLIGGFVNSLKAWFRLLELKLEKRCKTVQDENRLQL
jgi:hypothetical protein